MRAALRFKIGEPWAIGSGPREDPRRAPMESSLKFNFDQFNLLLERKGAPVRLKAEFFDNGAQLGLLVEWPDATHSFEAPARQSSNIT